jgi:hypothetical protein
MEQRIAVALLSNEDAMKLIGGTVDTLQEDVKVNKEASERDVDVIHKKIDLNRKHMETEFMKLQSHVRSMSPSPAPHLSQPPMPAAVGVRPPDNTLEITISGLEERGDECLFNQCQLEVFEILGCNYGNQHVEDRKSVV